MEETHIAGTGKVCKCPHHKVVPILIVLIGLDFLLGATGTLTWSFVDITWPILLIIGGLVKMVGCSCCSGK
jgi:hypothetical protein